MLTRIYAKRVLGAVVVLIVSCIVTSTVVCVAMLCLAHGGLELKKKHLTDTSLLVLLLGREGRNYKIF